MSTADLERIAAPRIPAVNSEATAVEQARAVAEVAAAVKVAQEFPRDVARAVERVRQACSQPALATRAFWTLPRGGKKLEGSSVHLAREVAACWGNIDHGVRELRRDDEAGVSEVIAWAWDQETNVRSSRSFVVPHAIMASPGKGQKAVRKGLTDLADIANNNNSVAARAVRETIWHVIPVWFRDEAESIAARTLQGEGTGKTLDQRKADAIGHYESTWNITRDQLEKRLGRPSSQWTAQDIGFLQVLTGEMQRGEKHPEGEFPAESTGVTAEEIAAGADSSNGGEG